MRKIIILLPFFLLLTACSHHGGWPWSSSSDEYTEYGPNGEPVQKGPEYRKADRVPPYRAKLKENCLTNGSGQKVCGYDCKRSGGSVRCAQEADQRCVVAPNGRIACGYDCKTSGSAAACGKYKYDNCVTNGYGNIRCGNNCYERDDGELVCGK